MCDKDLQGFHSSLTSNQVKSSISNQYSVTAIVSFKSKYTSKSKSTLLRYVAPGCLIVYLKNN